MQIVFTLEEAGRNITRPFFNELRIETSELIITLLVAWLIAGFLVKPLREMKNAAQSIANGDFSLRVKTASQDVVGQLATAFNNMADRLKDLTENLQTRVDEATVELRQKNAELLTSQKDLEEANRQLMELDRMKSDFVAMVSHELRTPLTSIIGFAKTLQTLHLSPQQQKKYLGIIQQEGKALSSFVEEYLDISNIESGTFYLQCSLQQLNQIISSVADTFQLTEGASLALNLNPDLPLLFIDAEKIRHVIYNLLDNAVKYGGRGVKITVATHATGEAITVSIHNSGSEIEPSERDRIFDKLYRGEKTRALHVRGSGLGLTIARAVVEGHGGRIWCDSDTHRGTTFFFTIPLQAHCDKIHLEKGTGWNEFRNNPDR
jgi:signal transduction histidine kinase